MILVSLVALVAALNPPRAVGSLPETATARSVRVAAVLLLGALVGFGAVAGPVVDWLAVVPPTVRIATAAVVVLTGARDLVGPAPAPLPGPDRVPLWLVPVLFPLLLRPAPGLLAVSVGADHGVPATAAVAVVAVGSLLAAVAWLPRQGRLADAAARASGGVAVAAGLVLVGDGVFSL